MLLSMTGFGKASAQLPSKKITVEIKSLNSKQFDMSTRVPSTYREFDLSLRNMAAAKLMRGKIEMVVTVESFGRDAVGKLNLEAMAEYKKQIEEAAETLNIPTPDDWYSVLLRFPETTRNDQDSVLSDEETNAVTSAANLAIDKLMAHRRAEGLKLEEFFATRINKISELLAKIPQFETERTTKIKERLAEGLAKIPAIEFDKGRLEQEMIFYIEKLDVNEEKQRLAQHLAYFIETMNNPEPGQGKKLGFISQEMGREINTLGSKSNHADMQRIVVMMKDELEQIKEQVLNVM